jgi:transposase
MNRIDCFRALALVEALLSGLPAYKAAKLTRVNNMTSQGYRRELITHGLLVPIRVDGRGRPALTPEQTAAHQAEWKERTEGIRADIMAGKSVREITKIRGCGTHTVTLARRALEAEGKTLPVPDVRPTAHRGNPRQAPGKRRHRRKQAAELPSAPVVDRLPIRQTSPGAIVEKNRTFKLPMTTRPKGEPVDAPGAMKRGTQPGTQTVDERWLPKLRPREEPRPVFLPSVKKRVLAKRAPELPNVRFLDPRIARDAKRQGEDDKIWPSRADLLARLMPGS